MSADNIILIKPEELYNEASGLRYDAKEPMDYLRDIVGMDWGEEGLGALYYLECTATGSRRVLKAVAADRENPFLPSVCHLWSSISSASASREIRTCAASSCARTGRDSLCARITTWTPIR